MIVSRGCLESYHRYSIPLWPPCFAALTFTHTRTRVEGKGEANVGPTARKWENGKDGFHVLFPNKLSPMKHNRWYVIRFSVGDGAGPLLLLYF